MAKFLTFVLHWFIISAPICNLFPPFVIPLSWFVIFALIIKATSICNPSLPLFAIPKAAPMCNLSPCFEILKFIFIQVISNCKNLLLISIIIQVFRISLSELGFKIANGFLVFNNCISVIFATDILSTFY